MKNTLVILVLAACTASISYAQAPPTKHAPMHHHRHHSMHGHMSHGGSMHNGKMNHGNMNGGNMQNGNMNRAENNDNAAYHGQNSHSNDGVKKNEQRNLNYQNNGATQLPPNTGNGSNR